tara:strand:- start:185 stop:583 length:399 start_codon:yes stop_codon:yes gene_type:complete
MPKIYKKSFDKSKAQLSHKGTVFSTIIFAPEQINSDLTSTWAFLAQGMKITPHKHFTKEIHFFIKGTGFIQSGKNCYSVKEGDAIFIPPNTLHETWNEKETELEFICISFNHKSSNFFLRILSLLYRHFRRN